MYSSLSFYGGVAIFFMDFQFKQQDENLVIIGLWFIATDKPESIYSMDCVVTCDADKDFVRKYNILDYIQNPGEGGRQFDELLSIPSSDLLNYDTLYNIAIKVNEDTVNLKYLDVSRAKTTIVELAKSINLRQQETSGIYKVIYDKVLGEPNTTIILNAAALLESINIAISLGQFEEAYNYLHMLKNTIVWIQ